MGNMYKESHLQATATAADIAEKFDGNNFINTTDDYGYGLCQWTYKPRKVALVNFLHEHGYRQDSHIGQCVFIQYESPTVLKELESIANNFQGDKVREATIHFHDRYLKSSDNQEQMDRRVQFAKYVFEKLVSAKAFENVTSEMVVQKKPQNEAPNANIKKIVANDKVVATDTMVDKKDTAPKSLVLKDDVASLMINKSVNDIVIPKVTYGFSDDELFIYNKLNMTPEKIHDDPDSLMLGEDYIDRDRITTLNAMIRVADSNSFHKAYADADELVTYLSSKRNELL
jgi:hypothetical protein